jgi:hypothetical protein
MLGKTVLLCTNDKGAARRLGGHLRGAGNEVMIADAAAAACALVAARAVDLVFVDGDTTCSPLDVVEAARGKIPVVVLSARGDSAMMLELICDRGVEHFLVHAGDADAALDDLAREVVVTAEKILRADLFGIEKYLPRFGTELAIATVRSASDRDGIVETIADHAEWVGAGREARRAVAAVVDELVTNAVYDAPVDAEGRSRYAALDRRHKVQLDPWEYVTVRWGSDGDTLAISVTDEFGALRPEHVRGGLRRCLAAADPIEQKAGGAGLGLYTALAYSAQLVINVDRGIRTEIVAIIDLRRRAAGARRNGRSLHMFFDDSRARSGKAAVDAAPTTVVVSDSLLVELRDHFVPSRRRHAEVIPLTRPKTRPPTVRARGSLPPPVDEPIGAGTACGLLRGAHDIDTAIQIALRFLTHHYRAASAFDVVEQRVTSKIADGDDPVGPRGFDVAELSLPLEVGGEVRWVLYGSGPRDEAPIPQAMLESVRRELERCLHRLDPEEPTIEVQFG